MFPNLHLTQSNIGCIFVATGFPENRQCFYRKVTDPSPEINDVIDMEEVGDDSDEDDGNDIHLEDTALGAASNDDNIVEIAGRSGKFQKTTTIHERYEARPYYLEKMCLAQFATHYQYASKRPKKFTFNEKEGISEQKSDQKNFNTEICLPKYLLLDTLGNMRLRDRPLVLRLHDSNKKMKGFIHNIGDVPFGFSLYIENWRSKLCCLLMIFARNLSLD